MTFFNKNFHPMSPGTKENQTSENAVQFLIYKNKQDEKDVIAKRLQQLLKNNPPGRICILQKTNQNVIDTGRFLKKTQFADSNSFSKHT